MEAVVVCPTDDMDVKAYETLLPQYFPRTPAELEYSRRFLPEDLGTDPVPCSARHASHRRLTDVCTGVWG